jgi:hypothetical protein
MIVLPRGKPVKEGVNPAGMNWREVLEKLHVGLFTGYLNFVADTGRGLLLFYRGRLASIRYRCGDGVLEGENALGHIFSASRSSGAHLDIYRLEPSLTLSLFNLIEGETFYRGQQLALLDIPHVLDLLKSEGFSGGLYVHAAEKVAIILMEQGAFLGFFHDGQPGLTNTADLAGVEEAKLPDLLEEVDLIELWDKVLSIAGDGL